MVIYRHYYHKLKEKGCENIDSLQFHYHPLPFNGAYNYAGTAYVNSNNIFQILARRIIDDHSFPAVYRAGMEAERPDAHWFLEQWIPFDFSCNSYYKENVDRQPDLRDGRYGDWRRATQKWFPYHPSHDDYQISGNCNRWIARCLSLDSRLIKIQKTDVEQAFAEVEEGHPTILSFSNHDFRDMREEINYVRDLISSVSKKYSDVHFHYSTAVNAMQKAEALGSEYAGLEIGISLYNDQKHAVVSISSQKKIFGTQPFFVFKTVTGDYVWDNLDYGEDGKSWAYVFDDKTLLFNTIEKVAIAANSTNGKTEIMIYDVVSNHKEHLYL